MASDPEALRALIREELNAMDVPFPPGKEESMAVAILNVVLSKDVGAFRDLILESLKGRP
jgi:hypothetical protein